MHEWKIDEQNRAVKGGYLQPQQIVLCIPFTGVKSSGYLSFDHNAWSGTAISYQEVSKIKISLM
jgi:hypothetical protein